MVDIKIRALVIFKVDGFTFKYVKLCNKWMCCKKLEAYCPITSDCNVFLILPFANFSSQLGINPGIRVNDVKLLLLAKSTKHLSCISME